MLDHALALTVQQYQIRVLPLQWIFALVVTVLLLLVTLAGWHRCPDAVWEGIGFSQEVLVVDEEESMEVGRGRFWSNR